MAPQVHGSDQLVQDLHMRSHLMSDAIKTEGIPYLWISSLYLAFLTSP